MGKGPLESHQENDVGFAMAKSGEVVRAYCAFTARAARALVIVHFYDLRLKYKPYVLVRSV